MHRKALTRSHLVLASLLCLASAQACALDATEQRIVSAVVSRQAQALDLLAEVVNIQSATENHAGVRKVGDVFARELAALGFETRWVDEPAEVARAGHLVAVRKGTKGKRLLLIGHLDTVLQGEAFRRDGNKAYGTGTSDMKGGDVVVIEALRALNAVGALKGRQVTVVFDGDEEDAGPQALLARQALIEAAGQSDIALAFEGAAPGVAVVGRRGIGAWQLQVTGKQAHSSGIFREDRGFGAIFETARILDRFRQELQEPYLTYNPSLILGGTTVTFDDES
jgi:glutamate carboxypeptidase